MNTINLWELWTVDFQSEENVQYIALYLWYVEFTEKTIQVNWEEQEIVGEDWEKQIFIPTTPVQKKIPNEQSARDFILESFKNILTDIPVKAFMEKRRIEKEIEDVEYEKEVKQMINSSIK